MPTVIFDIDGTLCETNAVDEECFVRACRAAFGSLPDQLTWEAAPHVTDSAIADWWCQQTRGRAPLESERDLAIGLFLDELKRALSDAPHRFEPIRGAPELLDAIIARHWVAGIATGGWRRSAQLKLAAAGLPSGLLLTSANDSHDRVEVFRLAAQRLRNAIDQRPILVGDACWDVTVARELGWGFLGVAVGERASKLRSAGATNVIADFTATAEVLRFLAAA